jgi:glycosyltransferase involved in cell wall biosynthesis
VPSLAPETSSLVAREAIACGTPVIAFPNGALSEAVEHGRTGFLASSVDEMAAAISQAGEIDSETCRDTARRRFSMEVMTGAYLDLYARLAARRLPLHGAA